LIDRPRDCRKNPYRHSPAQHTASIVDKKTKQQGNNVAREHEAPTRNPSAVCARCTNNPRRQMDVRRKKWRIISLLPQLKARSRFMLRMRSMRPQQASTIIH
jgi:hypothetical protein